MIEPLRALIDKIVLTVDLDDFNFKSKLTDVLNMKVKFANKTHYLDVAIKLYVSNTMNCLISNNLAKMEFIEFNEI